MIHHHFGDATKMVPISPTMELPELLHRIDELQARIVAAGPLSPDAKRKLDYRFRLDWNYHSNVMEGSSLTQQETRSIMMGNVTVSGKPIKDVLEMQGHDELITKLLGMAAGDIHLSESRIRETHKAIVHEDDPAKQAQVGHWKLEDNFLHNFKGERFDFLPFTEVPEAMHKLLDWIKADIDRIERGAKEASHPALLAFRFHLAYVTIHPFHDGNGRTARIFCNLLLMRFGFPPVVIRVDEKETYNRYLAEVQAYGASPELFFSFMAERLIQAQEVVVDAIEGRSVEQPDDVDMELALFKQLVKANDGPKKRRTPEDMAHVFRNTLRPLFELYLQEMGAFNELFLDVECHVKLGQRTTRYDRSDCILAMVQVFDIIDFKARKEKGEQVHQVHVPEEYRQLTADNLLETAITMTFRDFQKAGNNIFTMQSTLRASFGDYVYVIESSGRNSQRVERLYHLELDEQDRREVVRETKRGFLQQVREQAGVSKG